MKLAFFQGCNIPARIEQYSTSMTAVLDRLGVELKILDQFTCCGYPIRNVDEKAYLLPSVRNMAVAEREGLDIMVICNCCFNSLQKARLMMEKDESLKTELNAMLAKEGLEYTGKAEVKHFLTILHQDIGLDVIKKEISLNLPEISVATLQGCHVLRPREVTKFDDSFVPKITHELIELTGAKNVVWPGGLECCGAALAGFNDDLSEELLQEKITGAESAGANFIMPICSYCHLQLDYKQQIENTALPVLLFPQLLGLCMGIKSKVLGIQKNNTIDSKQESSLEQALEAPKQKKKRKAVA